MCYTCALNNDLSHNNRPRLETGGHRLCVRSLGCLCCRSAGWSQRRGSDTTKDHRWCWRSGSSYRPVTVWCHAQCSSMFHSPAINEHPDKACYCTSSVVTHPCPDVTILLLMMTLLTHARHVHTAQQYRFRYWINTKIVSIPQEPKQRRRWQKTLRDFFGTSKKTDYIHLKT